MKRVAVFLPGGLGSAHSGIHIPTLYALIEKLSNHFDIVAYSQRLPDKAPSVDRCGRAIVKFLDVTHHTHYLIRAQRFIQAFVGDHRNTRFDVVHGFWALPFGLYAVVLGRLLGLRSVVSLQGHETASLPDIGYGALRKQPQRSLILWVCKLADRVILQSTLQQKALQTYGLTRQDIQIIPQGVNTNVFWTSRNEKVGAPYRFVALGDLRDVKDPFTMLRAFSLISQQTNAQLRILGKDHYDGRLQDFVKDLGISQNVEFLGYVDYHQVQQYLQWADVLLHTSRHEGGGAVVMEAAAAGALICGTNVGLIYDLAQQEMAIAVEPGDSTGLAQQVLSFLQRQEEITSMRDRARQWAVAHDINWTTAQIKRVYETVLEQ